MDIVIICKCARIQTFPKWRICILGTWVNDRNLAPGHVHNTKKVYVLLNMKIYLKENRTYKYILLFLQRPHRTYCGNISKMPFSKYNLKTHFFFNEKWPNLLNKLSKTELPHSKNRVNYMILNFQIKIWHRKLLKELNIYSYLTLRTGPISAQNRIWSSNLFVHKIVYLTILHISQIRTIHFIVLNTKFCLMSI